MGKKIIIEFTDAPYNTDYFGLTMSGASASFLIDGPWDGNYLTPGFTKESATIGLYDYINSNLPVGTDINISKTSNTVNLFSESCNFVRFYKYTQTSSTLIIAGDINHVGATTKFVTVSSQDWTTNYTVGSNIINLTWSGASDPEQSIKGYDLSYRVGNSTTWISLPLILTNDGASSYNFTISKQITHEFRVRTVDTSDLKSEYKYFTQTIVALFQISQSSVFGSACSLVEPNFPVYINTTNINPSINDYVYIDSVYTNPFDGTKKFISGTSGTVPRAWKIKTPSNVYYTYVIDATGKITNIVLCNSSYNKGLLSIKTNTAIQSCGYDVVYNNNVYWRYNDSLVVGTSLYKDTSFVTPVTLGYYHILYSDPITNLDSDYIIKVGSGGNIISIYTFSKFCTIGTTTTSGGGCVDPLVSILLPNGITKFAGELRVDDIILTVHEVTKNLGEFKVLKKEIIIQEKVIVKFTDGSEIIVSDSHKFLMVDDTWKQIFDLTGNETIKGLENDKTIKEIIKIGEGDVVMFEIEDAHTYISDGLISHNKIVPKNQV